MAVEGLGALIVRQDVNSNSGVLVLQSDPVGSKQVDEWLRDRVPEQAVLACVVGVIILGEKRPALGLGWGCPVVGWHVFPGRRDPETPSGDVPLGPRAIIHGLDG